MKVRHLRILFVQDDIQLLGEEKGLWLTLGSKLVHTDFSRFGVEPSAQLLWTSGGHQTWWTSVTRALRTPSDVEETLTASGLVSPSPLTILRIDPNEKFLPEIPGGERLHVTQQHLLRVEHLPDWAFHRDRHATRRYVAGAPLCLRKPSPHRASGHQDVQPGAPVNRP